MPVNLLDKPNTQAAIRFVRKQWRVESFGFATAGHVPDSCHYQGLALDAMTSNRATGDAIAAWFIANPTVYGTTEVIWQRRIWTASQGWHPYTGSNPHTNHVHISLAPCGGSTAVTGASGNGGINLGVIKSFVNWLPGGSPPDPDEVKAARNTLLRIGLVVGGVILLILALGALLRPIVKPVTKAASRLPGG